MYAGLCLLACLCERGRLAYNKQLYTVSGECGQVHPHCQGSASAVQESRAVHRRVAENQTPDDGNSNTILLYVFNIRNDTIPYDTSTIRPTSAIHIRFALVFILPCKPTAKNEHNGFLSRRTAYTCGVIRVQSYSSCAVLYSVQLLKA